MKLPLSLLGIGLLIVVGCEDTGVNIEVGHTYTVAQPYSGPAPCFSSLIAFQEYSRLLRPWSKDKADAVAAEYATRLNTGDRVTILNKSDDSYSLKSRVAATGKSCYASNVGTGPNEGLFSQ